VAPADVELRFVRSVAPTCTRCADSFAHPKTNLPEGNYATPQGTPAALVAPTSLRAQEYPSGVVKRGLDTGG
jgi:hypothetical protein